LPNGAAAALGQKWRKRRVSPKVAKRIAMDAQNVENFSGSGI
jgi:hypothetical protein